MIEFHFFGIFGMPIKTLGSLGKIRVGRVTGNTHIFFFGLINILHPDHHMYSGNRILLHCGKIATVNKFNK